MRRLGALAVDDGGRRTCLTALLLAHRHIKSVMDPLQRSIPVPQHQIPVHRALGRQVLGQRLPLAARPHYVEDAVENLADVHRALATAALGRRNQWLDQRPLLVRQIAIVALTNSTRG